ncbi:MAG: hypothetical protein ABS79_03200 [Planctomycetes bacterium SCN 63-9]|nr:MAG: hypothetical protein ABS79_03200 [Planctomycetes bacterium SCN 63-9]
MFRKPASRWEIALPAGTYSVRVVSGDRAEVGRIRLDLEGTSSIRGRTIPRKRWIDRTIVVNVIDGRLTISGSRGTKLNFVEIARVGEPGSR